jgi:hypothetical protein
MAQFSAVTDADLADIAAYVNATYYSKPLTDGTGAATVKPINVLQNGQMVGASAAIVLPNVKFGSASSVKTTLALQAPTTGAVHIENISINNPLFALNRVPVSAADRQLLASMPTTSSATTVTTATSVVTVSGTDQACPATAFDLQAGAACGVEMVMTVSKPGAVTATLFITTDVAAKPVEFSIEATVDAQATGGAGGGGCTMRSTPGLFDPMLLLLSVLSLGVLAWRRHKKNKTQVVSNF